MRSTIPSPDPLEVPEHVRVPHVPGERHGRVVDGRPALGVARVDPDDLVDLVPVGRDVEVVVVPRARRLGPAPEVPARPVREVRVPEVPDGLGVDADPVEELDEAPGRHVAPLVRGPVRHDGGDAVAALHGRVGPPRRGPGLVGPLEVLADGEPAHGVADEDDAVGPGHLEHVADDEAEGVPLLHDGRLVALRVPGDAPVGVDVDGVRGGVVGRLEADEEEPGRRPTPPRGGRGPTRAGTARSGRRRRGRPSSCRARASGPRRRRGSSSSRGRQRRRRRTTGSTWRR